MTNEEMQNLANIIAEKVVSKIEKKQKEWDNEMMMEVQNMSMDPSLLNFSFEPLKESPKDLLTKQLSNLKKDLAKALELEDFEKCKIIDEKIIEVNKKLLNL
jgi:hypothetical protein